MNFVSVLDLFQGKCPQNWTYDNGSFTCVQIFRQPMNWSSAYDDCGERGGRLLEIRSLHRQNWLESHKEEIGGMSISAHIDFHTSTGTSCYRNEL